MSKSEMDKKFSKSIEDIKNYYTVASAMAKNEFAVAEENTRLKAEVKHLRKAINRAITILPLAKTEYVISGLEQALKENPHED